MLVQKKIVLSDAVTFGRKEMEKIVQSWKRNLKEEMSLAIHRGILILT
jgi:hypothetical protein